MTPLRSIPLDLAQASAITAVAPEVIHYLMARGAGPANLSVKAVAAWIQNGHAAKWQYPKPIVKKEELCAVR